MRGPVALKDPNGRPLAAVEAKRETPQEAAIRLLLDVLNEANPGLSARQMNARHGLELRLAQDVISRKRKQVPSRDVLDVLFAAHSGASGKSATALELDWQRRRRAWEIEEGRRLRERSRRERG